MTKQYKHSRICDIMNSQFKLPDCVCKFELCSTYFNLVSCENNMIELISFEIHVWLQYENRHWCGYEEEEEEEEKQTISKKEKKKRETYNSVFEVLVKLVKKKELSIRGVNFSTTTHKK